jgi:D-beta-D-heptose 7-phosphate kinase/D-beta-D-heptose 1-phosphate adenosyltransferase
MYKYSLKSLYDIIANFKNKRILVIGDIILDKFIWGTVSRISPEAPVPVLWAKSESFMPGGASNVANNISSLNAKVFLCGVIGNDAAGASLLSELRKKNINTEGVFVDKNRPTIEKTRIIAHHQQVVRIDREDPKPINSKIIKGILGYAEKIIKEIDAVIIEDYGKGVIGPLLLKGLIPFCKRSKKIVTVDPKQENFLYYKSVTAITPNRKEAEEASGVKIEDIGSLKSAGQKLVKDLDCEAVLVTLGEDGIALFQKDKEWMHIPTVAQEVYDVSGAGDTAIAVFTLAKSSGASMIEAAHISNVAAGIVVGKVGIAVCSLEELRSRMEQIDRYGVQQKKSSYPSESIFKK